MYEQTEYNNTANSDAKLQNDSVKMTIGNLSHSYMRLIPYGTVWFFFISDQCSHVTKLVNNYYELF